VRAKCYKQIAHGERLAPATTLLTSVEDRQTMATVAAATILLGFDKALRVYMSSPENIDCVAPLAKHQHGARSIAHLISLHGSSGNT